MPRMPAFSLPVEPAIVAFLVAVFLGGSIVNGLVGFGLALVAVNAMATVMDPKASVVVMSLISPFMSGYQLIHNWSLFSSWSRLRSLMAGAIVGTVVGAQLLVLLPTWAIALALGLFTVQFTIDRLRRDRPAVAKSTEQRLAPLAGFAGGMTNGALGVSGPIFGSYLFAIGLRGREFAFGISVVFFIQALVRLGALAVADQFAAPLLSLALVLLVPALLGQHIGQAYQGRVNPDHFQRVLLLILFISSVNMLVQGGRGLLVWLGVMS